MSELSDEQWCVLDLLMRSRKQGVSAINRHELLRNATLPQGVSVKLLWAALTMPADVIKWTASQQDFSITERGAALYNFRFGKGKEPATPTQIADAVICLPGPEHYTQ